MEFAKPVMLRNPRAVITTFATLAFVSLFVLFASVLWQISNFYDIGKKLQAEIIQRLSAERPGAAWALDEWQKCDSAAKNRMETYQCDLVVTNQAKSKGMEAEVADVLARRRSDLDAAMQSVHAGWPLSLVIGR